MSDRIRITDLRGRRELGIVVADAPGEGYDDVVPVAKAELDALLDAVEAARKIIVFKRPLSGGGPWWEQVDDAIDRFDFGDAR